MPIWPVLTKIMSITRTPSGMVCTEGGSLGFDGVPSKSRCARQLSRRESQRICKGRGCLWLNLSVIIASLDATCPGCGTQRPLRAEHSCPAGRGPNNSSLFPPLAAVVVVA